MWDLTASLAHDGVLGHSFREVDTCFTSGLFFFSLHSTYDGSDYTRSVLGLLDASMAVDVA